MVLALDALQLADSDFLYDVPNAICEPLLHLNHAPSKTSRKDVWFRQLFSDRNQIRMDHL